MGTAPMSVDGHSAVGVGEPRALTRTALGHTYRHPGNRSRSCISGTLTAVEVVAGASHTSSERNRVDMKAGSRVPETTREDLLVKARHRIYC